MYNRFLGARNPEKDEERLLTSLGAAGVLGGESRIYFVPATHGYNSTTTSQENITASSSGINGIWMITTDNIHAAGYFLTPAGWTGTFTVTALYRTVSGNGNLRMANNMVVDYFAPSYEGSTASGAEIFVGSTGSGAYKVLPISKAITEQALVRVHCYRYGANGDDTYDAAIFFLGWEITYG